MPGGDQDRVADRDGGARAAAVGDESSILGPKVPLLRAAAEPAMNRAVLSQVSPWRVRPDSRLPAGTDRTQVQARPFVGAGRGRCQDELDA